MIIDVGGLWMRVHVYEVMFFGYKVDKVRLMRKVGGGG